MREQLVVQAVIDERTGDTPVAPGEEDQGRPYVTFDREYPSMAEAMVAAIKDLESIEGVRVIEVRPPDIDVIELMNRMLKIRAGDPKEGFADRLWQVFVEEGFGPA